VCSTTVTERIYYSLETGSPYPVVVFTFVGRVLKFGRSAPMELFVVANSKSIVSPFPLSGVAGNGALGHVPFPLDFQQFHF